MQRTFLKCLEAARKGAVANPGALLFAIGSPLIAILGGYVCAWIAKRRPMHHAFVLVGVMASMSVLSAIREAGTDKPLWTSIAVGVLGCAAIPLGARLRIAHVRATS